MAMKSTLLVTLLVVVLAASQAEAQLSGLASLLNISGTVFCSINGSAITNATTPTPPFANALVQTVCGGNVIASSSTNGTGVFNIFLGAFQVLRTLLLSPCNVVVASPLSSCNSSLPSTGNLTAPLQIYTNGSLIPGIFSFIGVS